MVLAPDHSVAYDRWVRTAFLLLLLIVMTISATAQPTAELVGVDTISTPENELNAAFTPDQRTMYFTRTAGANRFGVILQSTTDHGRWTAPVVASFSGRFSDYDPFVSPDGSRLLFISTRPIANEAKSDFDIWVVERTEGGWSAARNLGAPINSDKDELYPTVASDGTLYFSSCGRGDSLGRCDLYRSRFRDGQYLAPENLGAPVNTPASETDAYIAPDQSSLIFAAYGRTDGPGDGDLFISHFRDGAWTAPRPLTFANTTAREYCPIVSPDGKTFYFTSQHGFSDASRSRAITAAELGNALTSIRNGFGNIYRVPIATLGGE
jgi:Tol biopolymer transport system component